MSLFNSPLIATLLLSALGALASVPPASASAPEVLPRLDATTELLVVAPHPDDETLCCAGVIQRVLSAGGQASVVWITSGDGSQLGSLIIEKNLFGDPQKMRAYAQRRMREARTAMATLGVPASGQLFLGYPDGGVLQLLSDYRTRPYRSRLTAAAAVPYEAALFPQHPYTGESLERDFAAVLKRVRPTLILAPSLLDSHPDHRGTGLLTIAATRDDPIPVRYWIVHGGEGWPSPRGLLPGVPLTPPPLGGALEPGAFELSPREEDGKLAALRAYETQLQVMEAFLLAFVRTTELYWVHPTVPACTRPP
jgi:LmbE family N-acetylglucosaminyl deacetylase